jgi:hypothetical protein
MCVCVCGLQVLYHTNPDVYEGKRIVGFEVEPESITHTTDDFDANDPKQYPSTCLKRDSGPQVCRLIACAVDVL